MPRTIRPVLPKALSYGITIVDDSPPDLRDVYHWLLRLSWPAVLLLVAAAWLTLNALFAAIYDLTGGIANAAPGSFVDAFFFSVQTMGTIGYGSMFPTTRLANGVVTLESVVGLVATALVTGLVFVRFARVRGRFRFGTRIAIGPIDGVPHLMVRLGNQRSDRIFDAQLRLTFVRTEKSAEGVTIYRNLDLAPVRAWAPNLSRAWNLLHRIDEQSPLYRETPESMAAGESEIHLALTGTDETTLQPVHGRCVWEWDAIVFGARLADVLSELADGNMQLDMRRFDDLTPTEPTPSFPFPRG